MTTDHAELTRRFYSLLDQITDRVGGLRRLGDCDGRSDWPRRGVYFFFEEGEVRSGSGAGPRVVRIGTHALTSGSSSSLWGRLSQHRGTVRAGGGNHRGSIFRLLVGTALAKRGDLPLPQTWGIGSGRGEAARRCGVDRDEVKHGEAAMEAAVSRTIGAMSFVWLAVPDDPGPASARATIERHGIALLSGFASAAMDPPSPGWLGRYCNRERVRRSGL